MRNRFGLALCASLVAVLGGCLSSSSNPGPGNVGDDSGDDQDGGVDPSKKVPEDCTGAFATIDKSYILNTSLGGSGGFTVDAQGMVLGLIPDVRQLDDVTSIPYLIQTASLDGKGSTVYTYPPKTIMGSVQSDATSIYFVSGGFDQPSALYKLPRAGGTATAVYTPPKGNVADFVMDDQSLYFVVSDALMSIPKAGGAAKTLVASRDNVDVANLMIDGATLYWAESKSNTLDKVDKQFQKMGTTESVPSAFGTVPASYGINQTGVTAGVLVFSTIEDDDSTKLYTLDAGGAPAKVDDTGGNPMLIADGTVYFNTPTGLKHAAIGGGTASTPIVITPSSVPYLSAIAVTPSELYYATETCIFRQAR